MGSNGEVRRSAVCRKSCSSLFEHAFVSIATVMYPNLGAECIIKIWNPAEGTTTPFCVLLFCESWLTHSYAQDSLLIIHPLTRAAMNSMAWLCPAALRKHPNEIVGCTDSM
ncbi:lignin medium expressed protein 14 [Heterobasidion irregulare TC 32-1]|uniref:Lignin medium expressed protein 14 n=1 Tax=Heterobasidion irregulare (strain TC 32-1) TaxID=747525 RepID=W4JTE8_HETIT|nr:lignin medium expressed protein 14 [Heterobasidion irregulare TC 32-1]ETW76822.1 lignin medium expressed protein 14 [Heterobasidion irregulare TC 32-1]